ncbi:MAG: hypothetical protein IPO15_25795 [Anaerolineae bacterium]|uniref:hypothetical protein n=1 Tax=Candidatus Amarolinea dominans TaxID=3140696 RepID=UPI0031375EED|nr:hypothetical protein [Anaerolineae bacterium]
MIPIGATSPAPPAGFERDAWRGAWGLGHNDWLLCYFGFLNASKGGGALIACLARLVQEGRPAHLVMIGGQVGSSDPTNQSYLEHVRRHRRAWAAGPCIGPGSCRRTRFRPICWPRTCACCPTRTAPGAAAAA